jgi:hypothetical protein
MLPAIKSEERKPDVLDGPIKPFIPKDPKMLHQFCERINKQQDRACNALKVVGKFSDEEVQKVRKWICKYQDRMRFLQRDMCKLVSEGVGEPVRMETENRSYYPRDIFVWPTVSNVVPLGQFPIHGSREDKIRIWDAICVSLRTIHDGFALLAIATWWEDEP